MSVNAVVQDGKILDTSNGKKSDDITKNAAKGYDKDAFMNILCAQMKYQDPLEPTSNTEYISQYATFSQVEQLSNMAEAFSMSRASDMVGKTVIVENENGEKIQGKVDYVTYSKGEATVSVDGKDYSIDAIQSVADTEYVEAHDQCEDFASMMDKLPDYNNLTYEDYESVMTANTFYQAMSTRAKNMLNKQYLTDLNKYVERVQELLEEATKAAKELAEKQQTEGTGNATGDSDSSEGQGTDEETTSSETGGNGEG